MLTFVVRVGTLPPATRRPQHISVLTLFGCQIVSNVASPPHTHTHTQSRSCRHEAQASARSGPNRAPHGDRDGSLSPRDVVHVVVEEARVHRDDGKLVCRATAAEPGNEGQAPCMQAGTVYLPASPVNLACRRGWRANTPGDLIKTARSGWCATPRGGCSMVGVRAAMMEKAR